MWEEEDLLLLLLRLNVFDDGRGDGLERENRNCSQPVAPPVSDYFSCSSSSYFETKF